MKKEKIQQHYDWFYSEKKPQGDILDPSLLNFLFTHLNGKKILDVGCGEGKYMELLQKQGFELVGIDISKIQVEKCKSKGLNAIIHDLHEKLPFEDNEFDDVIAFGVIEHLFNHHVFLKELKRVTRPDGKIFLSTPNKLTGSRTKTEDEKFRHPNEFTYFQLRRKLNKTFGNSHFFVKLKYNPNPKKWKLLKKIPDVLWKLALLTYPNFLIICEVKKLFDNGRCEHCGRML